MSFLFCASASVAATLQATYTFSGNLNAQESGVSALIATNPLGTNSFQNDTVFGTTHSTYAFNGAASPVTNQAGLTFNDGSNLISPTSYSIQILFELSGNSGWRRIADVQNRQSDDGLYVNPGSQYALYPTVNGSAIFAPDTYTDLILTNDGTNLTVYINGVADFSVADSQMNLSNANNPGQLLNLFLDNTAGAGQGEYASGRIALFEAFDGVLSASDAAKLAANPYANVPGGSTATPEPATLLLVGFGLAACGLAKKKAGFPRKPALN